MIRSGPNAFSIASAYGAKAAGSALGGASVTSPDSLHTVFGWPASARISAAHASTAPLAIGGFPA